MSRAVNALGCLTLCVMAFLLVCALLANWDKVARAECLEWRENARTLKGFYLTEAEALQCQSVGVKVIYK